jgi:ornithine cyclodeaminase/alanine dehydrogenase
MKSFDQLKVLYLSRKDVENVGLSMSEIIDEVEHVFIEKGMGNVEMPPKPGIHPAKDSFIHAMPAYVAKKKAAGLKWVSGNPENFKIGLPYILGLIIMNDPETGAPLAIMDAAWITAMRTAAATAVAAKYMASKQSKAMAILGCGVEARTHLEAIPIVCPDLKTIKVYDIVEAHQKKFIEEMKIKFPQYQISGMVGPQEAVDGADIIISVIAIEQPPPPIIQKQWLKEGCFGSAVAFDSGWSAPALACFDKIVTDDIDQFNYYRTLGFFKETPDVEIELADLVSGKRAGRETDKERILSMNLGLAIEDMVTGIKIFERAKEKGLGTWLPL